jgi:hypothetical protein
MLSVAQLNVNKFCELHPNNSIAIEKRDVMDLEEE